MCFCRMYKEKKITVFFLYDKSGNKHEAGEGVLKGLVMWKGEGNIIFI